MASARIAQVGAGQGACRLFHTDKKMTFGFLICYHLTKIS